MLFYQLVGATENTRVRRATAKASGEERGREGTFWIFWHGCNSVAVGFLVFGAMLELQMERPSTILIGVLFGFTAAYFAHWQKYVSGHRRVTSQFVDVAETQLMLASVHFLTVLFGPSLWVWEIWGSWQVNHVVLAILFWRSALVILNYWLIILEGGPGEDGTTTAGTAVLSPAIPGAAVLAISYMLVNSRASAFDKVGCRGRQLCARGLAENVVFVSGELCSFGPNASLIVGSPGAVSVDSGRHLHVCQSAQQAHCRTSNQDPDRAD